MRHLLLFLLAVPVAAQIPDGGKLLTADFLAGARRPNAASVARSQIVDVDHPQFAQALRVATLHEEGPSWSVEVGSPTTAAVKKGAVALVHFWARGAESSDESGEVFATIYAQKNSPDWDKSLFKGISVGAQWREYFFPFEFIADYAAGAATVNFGLGSRRQTLEIAGFEVLYYGTSLQVSDLPQHRATYAGREPDAPWRAAARARIEQHRKGDFTLELTGPSGQPLAGAEIEVEQHRHAFRFGSALQMWRLTSPAAEDRIYREKVLELFNAASNENALKWPPWNGDWGDRFSRDRTLAGFRWLEENGLHRRGHVLVWPGWSNLPNGVVALEHDPDAASLIPAMVIEHIDEITQATRGLVQEWDVINEPYSNHDIMDLSGERVMVDWFLAARRNLPQAPLYLNDYSILSNGGQDIAHQNHYERTIVYLIDQGAPITGLGMQGHFGDNVTAPEKLLSLLDRFARFGLDIKITEFDINTDDQDLVDDYTRDFMTLVFSHPAVAGFQFWGFWEKAHWRPGAALYAADWTPRPHAQVYRNLVFEEWWTSAKGQTDADGRFRGRGFYGDYTVKVRRGEAVFGAEFTLARGAKHIDIRLVSTEVKASQSRPGSFNLEQNYPNPFNSATHIPYTLAAPGRVRLRVYNAAGQHVKTLMDASLPAGERVATWDGTDLANKPAGTGTYIYELAADQLAQRRSMLLLR